MRTYKATLLGLLALGVGLGATTDARSDDTGVQAVYGNISTDQIEHLSSAARIQSALAAGTPTLIWQVLEQGEKVECLDCVSAVAPFLYDANVKTREIAAWWLRRRMFGVFGPGEVYQQTLTTLQTDPDPTRRAYAAYALGEFLENIGVAPVATALASDSDPGVRAAAAFALGRLNSDGAGALETAMSDSQATVQIAALTSAGRINSFAGVANVAALVGSPSALVRKRAVEILDEMVAKDSVAAVIQLAQSDPDEQVRIVSCHALGNFGNSSATTALNAISTNDSSQLVRDMASIALRRL